MGVCTCCVCACVSAQAHALTHAHGCTPTHTHTHRPGVLPYIPPPPSSTSYSTRCFRYTLWMWVAQIPAMHAPSILACSPECAPPLLAVCACASVYDCTCMHAARCTCGGHLMAAGALRTTRRQQLPHPCTHTHDLVCLPILFLAVRVLLTVPVVGISWRYGHSAPRLHAPLAKNVHTRAMLRCGDDKRCV